jgi:DNA-directed RNA polymerase subunit RPC12/RpoP
MADGHVTTSEREAVYSGVCRRCVHVAFSGWDELITTAEVRRDWRCPQCGARISEVRREGTRLVEWTIARDAER